VPFACYAYDNWPGYAVSGLIRRKQSIEVAKAVHHEPWEYG